MNMDRIASDAETQLTTVARCLSVSLLFCQVLSFRVHKCRISCVMVTVWQRGRWDFQFRTESSAIADVPKTSVVGRPVRGAVAGGRGLAHAARLTAWIHQVNPSRGEFCNNAVWETAKTPHHLGLASFISLFVKRDRSRRSQPPGTVIPVQDEVWRREFRIAKHTRCKGNRPRKRLAGRKKTPRSAARAKTAISIRLSWPAVVINRVFAIDIDCICRKPGRQAHYAAGTALALGTGAGVNMDRIASDAETQLTTVARCLSVSLLFCQVLSFRVHKCRISCVMVTVWQRGRWDFQFRTESSAIADVPKTRQTGSLRCRNCLGIGYRCRREHGQDRQ